MIGSEVRPWPYHLEMDGEGYVCVEDEQTGVVIRSQEVPRYDNVVPSEYDYSDLPPYAEQTAILAKLVAGMGQPVQTLFHSKAYSHAIGIDASIGGRLRLAPESLMVTPTTTGGDVYGFVEGLHSGAVAFFMLAGRYILKRTSDANNGWTTSKDLTAGKLATKGVRFKNGASGTDALYVSTDEGKLWQYAAGTWTAWSAPSGQTAVFVETIRTELWVAGGNVVAKTASETADPLNGGGSDYAASIKIGDASSSITWMGKLGDDLLIFKDDRTLWTVDRNGLAVLLRSFGGSRDAAFGRGASVFLDYCWFRNGEGAWRIGPAGAAVLDVGPIGPERLMDNTSEVRGQFICSAGHVNWFNYVAIYNPLNGHSYLLKWGEWLNPESTEDFRFAPVYNGALVKWTSRRVTAMSVTSVPNATNDRLYVGFADGSYDWIILPKATPDPLIDTACRFQTTGFLYYSDQHHNKQADDKNWRSVTVFGPSLSSAYKARFGYGLYRGATYADLSTDFTISGQRVDLPDRVTSKILAPRLELIAAANTSSPDVEGIALHAAVVPALVLQHETNVLAVDYAAKRDGTADHKTAEDVKTAIKAARKKRGTVTLLHPDEGSLQVTVTKYGENVLNLKKRAGIGWTLPIQMVEFRTNVTVGIIGNLGAFTVGDLGTYTASDLDLL